MPEPDKSPLHLLLIEDSASDVELIQVELRRAGFTFDSRVAATEAQVVDSMDTQVPDLVISDYSMPGFNGIAALAVVRDRLPGVPFIFVSGTIGEERAIEALRGGATDYVLKDRLGRLLPAVRRALAEVQEREQRRGLEKQLIEAQKMEAVGRLASGVAHDFNNLLSVILANVELAAQSAPAGAEMPCELSEIGEAARRAASLTRRLLAISRHQAYELTVFDLNRLVLDLEHMLRALLGDDATLALQLASSELPVRADSSQLEQVLLNLVINARDAMPTGGTVTVATSARRVEVLPTGDAVVHPGEHAVLAVRDTGTGMSAEVRARLFEAFFTTKPPGKGTGLGLATSHAIVQGMGGAILVETTLGLGTAFEVVLPRVRERLTQPPAHPIAELLPRGTETLLLVEDDAMLAGVETRVLTMLGYTVLRSSRAEDALEILAQQPDAIDLVITDVVLPGMDGIELSVELRRRRPDQRILFMSGYADHDALTELAKKGQGCLLHKPFVLSDFAVTVRNMLDGVKTE